MNTTLCFSIIWILPIATLLTGCAGSTATSISFENYTDDSIPGRLLHEEPSSTEGIQGSFQEIDAKSGASPPEERTPPINQSIAVPESAAEERNPYEAEADLILTKLHAELIKSHPHLIPSDDVFAALKEFVQPDSQRKLEFLRMKVLFALAKHTPLAQESTSAMMNAETETAQVLSNQVATSTIQKLWEKFRRDSKIPESLDAIKGLARTSLKKVFLVFVRQDKSRNDEYQRWLTWRKTNFGRTRIDFTIDIFNKPTETEADEIMSTLWKDFLSKNKLPEKSPTIDLLDSNLQDLLKPKFFKFIRSTNKNSEQWMQWLNCKAGTEEALAKERLTPAVVQEMTVTRNVLTNHLAMEVIQGLWTDFLPLLSIMRKQFPHTKTEIFFLTFVSLDPVRLFLYDEWRKWRITNFGTNGPEFMEEMVYIPTEQEADEIEKTLWSDFLRQEYISREMSPLDQLQPELLRPRFFAFIGEDPERSVKWMQTRNVKDDDIKVVASIKFTTSYQAQLRLGLLRSIIWSELRQWILERYPHLRPPLTFDRVDKSERDEAFLHAGIESRKRDLLLDALAKLTQPAPQG